MCQNFVTENFWCMLNLKIVDNSRANLKLSPKISFWSFWPLMI